MADYIALKRGETIELFSYAEGSEQDFLAQNYEPGEHFIRVSSTRSYGDAQSQAQAWFDGTHEEPEQIDRDVRRIKELNKD